MGRSGRFTFISVQPTLPPNLSSLGPSPKNTAGVHVSRIVGKLGAASRTEAASIAHRAGLDHA